MICAMFHWQPGEYDEEFNRLKAAIESVARASPGFLGVETWHSSDGRRRWAHY